MEITGREILAAALDLALGAVPEAERDEADIANLARHTPSVLDSLNTSPATAVGGVQRVEAEIPAGAAGFTWGPGGTVKEPLPTAVSAWNVLRDGQEYPQGGRLATTPEWAALRYRAEYTADVPDVLYWPRTQDPQGRYTFQVWPRVSSPVTLALYAVIPRFDRINAGQTYTMDQGRARYLIAKLALTAGTINAVPLGPDVYNEVRSAADRLGLFTQEERVLEVPSSRFLIGDFYNRGRHGGGY